MNEQVLGAVESALDRAGLLGPDAVLLAALSGGADSVALLYALHTLAKKHGFAVRAAHVEHGLRGESSLRDAAFCAKLCKDLHVPFTCDHAALAGGMDDPGAEARARDARYALLMGRAKECHADALVLAHHQNDQAETVLAHLLRGSGARGLGGMLESMYRGDVRLLRPLLTVDKQTILQSLDGRAFCQDESNTSDCCQRNRLRNVIMPLLEAEAPRAAAHMAQTAHLMQMDDAYISAHAVELFHRHSITGAPYFCLQRAGLMDAPDAVAVRTLRMFVEAGVAAYRAQCPDNLPMQPSEQSLSAADSLRLLQCLRQCKTTEMNLPQGLKAVFTPGFIHVLCQNDAPLVPKAPPAPIRQLVNRTRVQFGEISFSLRPYRSGIDAVPDGVYSIAAPNRLLAQAGLRVAQPGDFIRPFGAGGSRPLRRYFMDKKVDRPFRAALPLLCVGQEVLWAACVGAGEPTRLTEEPATRISVIRRQQDIIKSFSR